MKLFKGITLLIIILLITKVDFRLETDIYCCSDDFDYYSHAETIALDFDFDYSNQFKEYAKARYFKNDKMAPIGFMGSGLLAAPFLFIGNLVDKLFNQQEYVNFKILFYSFSPIFYLYISTKYLIKIKNKLAPEIKNSYVLLIFLSSGISYYAFERFSMTHVYEVFTITMVCYFSIIIHENILNKLLHQNLFLLVLFLFLGFNVRWVNYFIFFIPYFLPKLLGIKKVNIHRYKEVYFFAGLFTVLTLYINKQIYGVITLNPNYVYSSGVVNSFSEIFTEILTTAKNFLLIIFSQEFGIFYFSPIIFLGLLLTIFNFIAKPHNFHNLIGLLIFFQTLAIVLLWKGTAGSYGFRYLLCLTPLALIILLDFLRKIPREQKNKFLKVIIIFSIFSFVSTVFFETTELTQLSTDAQINSFGETVAYTQPQYLSGYIQSFFSIEAYMKIFVTSFLGFLFFNTLFRLITPNQFLEFIEGYGVDLNTQKVLDLLYKYAEIESTYILIVVLIVILIFIKTRNLISSDT